MVKVYVSCKNYREAKKIGLALLKKRLAACCSIIPRADSFYFWPPASGKISKNADAILLVATSQNKYSAIEREVKKLHSYKVPCILEIPVSRVSKTYLKWLNETVDR